MTKETVYENKNYRVDINREKGKYEVVNKQHDMVEASEENKPQALILAKQFDILLEDDSWSKQLDEMYGVQSATLHSIN